MFLIFAVEIGLVFVTAIIMLAFLLAGSKATIKDKEDELKSLSIQVEELKAKAVQHASEHLCLEWAFLLKPHPHGTLVVVVSSLDIENLREISGYRGEEIQFRSGAVIDKATHLLLDEGDLAWRIVPINS